MVTGVVLVGIGGFFGAIARYSISKALNKEGAGCIPYGTLLVNLAGAFLLGVVLGVNADRMITLLIGTGFMGAFTTFSTLKIEMGKMLKSTEKGLFYLYLSLTYGGGLFLAYLGYVLGGVLSS